MDLESLARAASEVVDGARVRLGVADPAPFPEVAAEIERRDRTGERGSLGFTYRDPATSTRPDASFPWARSIVVAAVGYLRDGDGEPGPDGPARSVARFADGDRYGDLRRVLDRIAGELEADGRRAVPVYDDDRLVDRALAVRSGVAWWGKSTMAITPGLGPWFLIGSVVTDAPIRPTEPMQRTCGSCTACLPACPTGAIVAPGVLDARRCLAAVLQARGSIPAAIRPAVGGRVYGCDDCLTACPPGHGALGARPIAVTPTPVGILARSDEELLEAFGHWYIPGRRVRFVRRNALVALGNTGGPEDVGLLAGYAGHPDALLRAHAAWALGAIGSPGAGAVLAAADRVERDPRVRDEIAAARTAAYGSPASLRPA